MIQEVDRFFDENIGRWAPKTQKNYAKYLYKVSEWLEAKGISDPLKVTTELLLEWLKDSTLHTRRSAPTAFRVFFRWAVGDLSPAASIRLPKVPESSRRALSPAEALEMLAVPDTSTVRGKRDLAILSLVLDTGLRNAELCNALLSKLQLRECALQMIVKGGRWELAIFSQQTMRALEEWLNVRGEVAVEDLHIFVSLGGFKTGTKLGGTGLESIIRSIARRAGIGHVCPHELRHSFAELALRAGSPTRILQRAGRWKDIKMVEHYTRRIELEAFRDYFPVAFLMEYGEKKFEGLFPGMLTKTGE